MLGKLVSTPSLMQDVSIGRGYIKNNDTSCHPPEAYCHESCCYLLHSGQPWPKNDEQLIYLPSERHLRLNAFSFVLLCVCTISSDWTAKGLCEVTWELGNVSRSKTQQGLARMLSFLVASSLPHDQVWEVIRIRDTLTKWVFVFVCLFVFLTGEGGKINIVACGKIITRT